MNVWQQWAAIILGALGVFYGAWKTAAVSKSAQRAAPYEALARRVEKLERSDADKGRRIDRQDAEIRRLKRNLFDAVDHIDTLHEWIEGGALPPPPTIPAAIKALVRRIRYGAASDHT